MLGCMPLSLDLEYFHEYIFYAFSLYITCRCHHKLHGQQGDDPEEVKMKLGSAQLSWFCVKYSGVWPDGYFYCTFKYSKLLGVFPHNSHHNEASDMAASKFLCKAQFFIKILVTSYKKMEASCIVAIKKTFIFLSKSWV